MRPQLNEPSEDEKNGLYWLDQRWTCGTPDLRCRFCSQPVIWAPDCLGMAGCRCGMTHEENLPARTKPATRTWASRKTSAGKTANRKT